ncbi:hypothetical protein RF11_12565 [Thelohanellus kitauei]|uniref:Uncharacterized protein n=1 Tax=Thelohanellus kitauei TaxID=669202 RepID=A0A0C2MM06_THEKT|nr:hypothetical protein RF11_12565 [Thelohanellus kitauei]
MPLAAAALCIIYTISLNKYKNLTKGIDVDKLKNTNSMVKYVLRVNPKKFSEEAKEELKSVFKKVVIGDLTTQMVKIADFLKRIKPKYAMETFIIPGYAFLNTRNDPIQESRTSLNL